MLSTIKALIKTIEEVETVYHSAANWRLKYDLINASYNYSIYPLIDTLGLSFDWWLPNTDNRFEPDAGYEKSTTWLVEELIADKKELEKIFEENSKKGDE